MDPSDAEEYTQALGQVVAGGYRQVALGQRLGVPAALGLSTGEWVEQRLGGYVRTSIPERREAVAELTAEGMSTRQIGEVLGVSHDTVAEDRKSAVGNPTRDRDEVSESEESSQSAVGNLTAPAAIFQPPAEPTAVSDEAPPSDAEAALAASIEADPEIAATEFITEFARAIRPAMKLPAEWEAARFTEVAEILPDRLDDLLGPLLTVRDWINGIEASIRRERIRSVK